MTIDVSNNNPRISYAIAVGSSQTSFAIPFDFFEDSDVKIYVNEELKVAGSDYTIAGGDGSTGSATFSNPVDGEATVVVVRHVSLERVTDFVAGQDINRAALNTQLDTITAQIADLDDKVGRTIHLNDYDEFVDLPLPSLDDRKGKYIGFNASTGAIEAGPSLASVQASADAAAASATSAAASAQSSDAQAQAIIYSIALG